MARKTKKIVKGKSDGQNKLFWGVIIFAVGFAWWSAKMGLIGEEMFWPNVLMVLGIILVFKSVLFK